MIRKYLIAFLCIVLCHAAFAQPVIRLDSLNTVIKLDTDWMFRNGDNPAWASPSFNDKGWDTMDIGENRGLEYAGFKGIGWFRLHLKIGPALFNQKVLLLVSETGASDVYLNGKLVKSFGKVGNINTEVPYDPSNTINYITLSADTMQVLAIRFSCFKIFKKSYIDCKLSVELANLSESNTEPNKGMQTVFYSLFLSAIFLTVAIFHLLLFLYYRKVRTNLYYSLLAILLSIFWLYPFLNYISSNPLFYADVNQMGLYIFGLSFFLIILLLYEIFKKKYNWFFWAISGLTLVTLISASVNIEFYKFAVITVICASCISGIIIVIRAVRQKQPGAWIIASGFVIFLSMVVGTFTYMLLANIFFHQHSFSAGSGGLTVFVMLVWALSIPISMSVYLASDFSRTNKRLALEITHVKQLSEQNIEKEREKQQIIEGQKQELEVKVKEATAEVMRQKDELSEKNKEITDSINYAQRIQNSILPTTELLKEVLGEYMIIYKPKDVVSGDFYWCHAIRDKVVFAVADCTGHGVPGAFMSMIGNSILNGIVIGSEITEANVILDEMRARLIFTLQQSAQHITTRDGMDIAVCVWDKSNNTLQYAGANNSLYLVSRNIATNGSVKESARVKLSNDHLLEILPDKQPIGYQEDKMNNPFTKNIIQLKKGDTIFITSDGFTDQFGGTKNKKFTSKRFRELISSLVGLPLAEQQALLDKAIEDWKSSEAQTDDICLMGVRIN